MSSPSSLSRPGNWLIGLCALLLTLGLYRLGLPGDFLFDDTQNIVINPAVQPAELSPETLRAAWHGNRSGPLGRPIASISFALDYRLHGLDAGGFKQTNILLHLLCGAVLFGALRSLLLGAQAAGRWPGGTPQQASLAALAAATLWLLHPLHVSTVLYVVQRMAILTGLFSLLGIWAYAQGRLTQLRGGSGWGWLLLAMPACTLLATLSKESGLLTPLLCAVCEYCLFGGRAASARTRQQLLGLYLAAAAALIAVLLWKGAAMAAYVLGGYHDRPFTVGERLLTEARVLWWYLGLLLTPDLSAMNLYHDDFLLSTGWRSPWTTAPAVLGGIAALVVALALARRYPLPAFALLFFVAGHLMESTVFALELVFEHRNYLPSAGLFLLAGYGLARLAALRQRLAAVLTLLLVAVLAAQLAGRSQLFGDQFRLILHSLQHHPDSVRTQIWAGQAYKLLAMQAPPEQQAALRAAAAAHFGRAAALDPTDAVGLIEVLGWQAEARGAVDAGDYADLVRRISRPPIHASTVVALQNLAREVAEGHSRITAEQALDLLGHLERSPQLWSQHRGAALEAIGLLRWHQGATGEAAGLYDQAQELRPDDAYLALGRAATRLNLGQPEAARAALRQARALDRGDLTAGLDRLEADIAALERASGSLSTPINQPDAAP